ncbi:unnamed protein product [Ceratitis capitata]|uniref:(Mediterranean fruit fly) hypothetical protein n=1 Tax=Ceratitis capitata TaxID=7213 RepID=A0A811VA24_CERCA|nr:unnamed protein product [Ceratitis capitata]
MFDVSTMNGLVSGFNRQLLRMKPFIYIDNEIDNDMTAIKVASLCSISPIVDRLALDCHLTLSILANAAATLFVYEYVASLPTTVTKNPFNTDVVCGSALAANRPLGDGIVAWVVFSAFSSKQALGDEFGNKQNFILFLLNIFLPYFTIKHVS